MCSDVPTRLFPALVLMTFFASASAAPVQSETYRVLLLHSFSSSAPVNADWHRGIAEGFSSTPELVVEIESEFPQLSRLGDAGYVSNLLAILRQKYAGHQPHLIIPTYTPAFKFLLDHGEDLFPGVPIVFLAADSDFVAAQNLAPHITGITSYPDVAGTLELALNVHPDTHQVVVIVGSGDVDKQFERSAREALRPFGTRIGFTWLRGLPLGELRDAVRELAPDTVILYLVVLEDRTGAIHVPVNTLRAVSTSANAPIYGLWDTLLGHGIVGGHLANIEDMGLEVAQMGLRVLRGASPAAVPIIDRRQNATTFDGQQLARWRIDDDRLPAGSRIVNRRPSAWDEHRAAIMTAIVVIGTQGVLIFGLLLNRAKLRRTRSALQEERELRTEAESVAGRQRRTLAKFSKERALGAVATGIAHEVNQPLVALQNYAQAARRRLHSNVDETPKLMELFEKMEQQARRAGDIVQRIRTLVSSDMAELKPIRLDRLLEQVSRILGPQLESAGCRVDIRSTPDVPAVLADELQVQLVMVNLLQNAMNSMESIKDQSEVVIAVDICRINNREVQVSVVDAGPGVPPERVGELFDPFSTGRTDGTGLGLAICQTIIEAHGGRIWYTPGPSRGATFEFTLRVAPVQ